MPYAEVRYVSYPRNYNVHVLRVRGSGTLIIFARDTPTFACFRIRGSVVRLYFCSIYSCSAMYGILKICMRTTTKTLKSEEAILHSQIFKIIYFWRGAFKKSKCIGGP
jgi:hypothetical protein